MARTTPDPPTVRLERIEWLHLGLVVAVVAAAALTRWLEPWSTALGGAVMGGNVWLMKGVVRRALQPGGRARMAAGIAMLVAKFGVLLGLLGLLFWRISLDGASFAVGITLFLIASVAEAVRVGMLQQREE